MIERTLNVVVRGQWASWLCVLPDTNREESWIKVIFYDFFCFLKLKRYLLKYRLCGMISSSSTAHHIMLSTFDMLLRKRSRRHCFPQASGQGTNICKYTGCVSPLISILSQYRLMCSLPPEFYNVVKLISHQMQLSYLLCIFMRSIYYESQVLLQKKTLHFTYWYEVVWKNINHCNPIIYSWEFYHSKLI